MAEAARMPAAPHIVRVFPRPSSLLSEPRVWVFFRYDPELVRKSPNSFVSMLDRIILIKDRYLQNRE